MDERARYRMQRRIAEAIDEETAVTLMAHLPPGGWAEMATKTDLAGIHQRLDRFDQRLDRFDQRLDLFDQRLDRIDQRLTRMLIVFIATTISAVLATAGVVVTSAGGL